MMEVSLAIEVQKNDFGVDPIVVELATNRRKIKTINQIYG